MYYFTNRELEIIHLIRKYGYSNRELADKLKISVRTVESHVANVLSESGLSDRTKLITAPRSLFQSKSLAKKKARQQRYLRKLKNRGVKCNYIVVRDFSIYPLELDFF